MLTGKTPQSVKKKITATKNTALRLFIAVETCAGL